MLSPAAQFDAVTKHVLALTQTQIATAAKAANAKIMAAPPTPLAVTRHVDGVRDAPEEAVRPDGVIVYDYNRLDQVAAFALDTLRELSPVDSGDYVRGHVVMLNGQIVGDLHGWKPGDEISISNPEPYTRKIEIGQAGFSHHGHVYEKASRIVIRRFAGIARVSFTYRPAPPGAIHQWASHTRLQRRSHRTEWLTAQPTIVITELTA